MDKDYILKAENYLRSRGFNPDVKNIMDTLDNTGILEIFIHNGTQKYVFCGMRATSCISTGKKWATLSDASADWQDFLLKNSIGKEKLSVLLGIRDIKNREYEESLRQLLRNYDNYSLVHEDTDTYDKYYCSEVSDAHREMLDAEEQSFSYYITTTEDEDVEIERTIRRRQADFNEFHINKIKNFIDREVCSSYNENGEEVFEFTPQQLAVYEILKDLRDTTDFVFRHQLYRFDQMQESQN